MQPGSKKSSEETMLSCAKRIEKVLPTEALSKLYMRYHSFEESFPLDPSGKRSITTLINNGVDDKCKSINDILQNNKDSVKKYVKTKN